MSSRPVRRFFHWSKFTIHFKDTTRRDWRWSVVIARASFSVSAAKSGRDFRNRIDENVGGQLTILRVCLEFVSAASSSSEAASSNPIKKDECNQRGEL